MCKSQALLLQMVPIFVWVIKGLQHNRITYCRDVSGSKVNIFCMEYSFLALVEGRTVQLEAAVRDMLSFKTGKKIMPSRASQHVAPRGRGEVVGRPNWRARELGKRGKAAKVVRDEQGHNCWNWENQTAPGWQRRTCCLCSAPRTTVFCLVSPRHL